MKTTGIIALTLMLYVLATSGTDPSTDIPTSESSPISLSVSQTTEGVSNEASTPSQKTDSRGTDATSDTNLTTTATGNNYTTTGQGPDNGAVPIHHIHATISLTSSFVTLYLWRLYF